MAETAAGGEVLLARLRVRLLLLVVIQFLPGWDPLRRLVGLSVSASALALSLLNLFLVTRRFRPWMSFASAAADVTLVTLGLTAFTWLGKPHWAVNNKVTFEVYLLATSGAALRFDWRVCVLTGILAVVQYGALVTYVTWRWPLNDPRYAPWEDGLFSWPVQVSRMMILASPAALSTVVVLRVRRLRRLSTTDRLTGLDNRGVFEGRLAEELLRARRHPRPFAIALVDIDRFKLLNDTHGHGEGDRVLRITAELIRQRLRGTDVTARHGGDEFALLLPETGPGAARALLEEVRLAVAAERRLLLPSLDPLTCSAGIAAWPDDGASAEDLLAAADARLYEAKRGGRNCIVGVPEPPPDGPDFGRAP